MEKATAKRMNHTALEEVRVRVAAVLLRTDDKLGILGKGSKDGQ